MGKSKEKHHVENGLTESVVQETCPYLVDQIMGEIKEGIVKFMDNIQYVVDNTGKPVSAIVPIDLWNNLEQAKDILEHVYLSGLIDSRKHDTISCTLDDMLKMEGLTRHGLES